MYIYIYIHTYTYTYIYIYIYTYRLCIYGPGYTAVQLMAVAEHAHYGAANTSYDSIIIIMIILLLLLSL